MDAHIIVKYMSAENGFTRPLYQVEYCAVPGNGYDTADVYRTFGVYIDEDVAEFVKNEINKGSIHPVRKG